MIDIDRYMTQLTQMLRQHFGSRLSYVGLQGSYLRGEATDSSDIDAMVVIDRLDINDLDAYRATMAGVYTTSVNERTIDEAPMAYKSLTDIIDVIRDSVDVIEILKPIYNFKASD